MAIIKTRFAGFLRGLFGRGDDREPALPAGPPPSEATTTHFPRPAVREMAAPTPSGRPAALPGKARPQPATASTMAAPSANDIEIPLEPVMASLPMDLRAKLMAAPLAGATIRLPAEKVISQLAFGAVRISFGELRRLAPGLFLHSSGEQDNKLVNLPLQEILHRLNPELLARRTARKVEVADEIVGPFAGRGRGFTFTTQPLKAASAPASVVPSEPEPPTALVPPIGIRQAPPPAIPAQILQRSITPAAPAGAELGIGSGPLPLSPRSPRSISPAVPGAIDGHGHGTNGNGHSLSPAPGLRPQAVNGLRGDGHNGTPTPLKASPAAPPRPAGPEVTVLVALKNLCEKWPDALKAEIAQAPLAQASVALESSLILPGLKRGRILATWKQIRQLANPGSAPSPYDELELELPLKVIAPLFVTAQKHPPQPQARASVAAEIPDLFFGFPQPTSVGPTPAAPAQSGARPAPAGPLVPPLPKAPTHSVPDTNYYRLADKESAAAPEEASVARDPATPQTDFTNRHVHPKDVVARAAALGGVTGAIVAMQDGLRVACQVPADLNGDTLAAFLPQIFERVNQSTRELRMGALNNLNFTVGNIPWKIFHVNAVYFAAFGRAGEPLPSAQLAQLAAELDRKKNQ